MATISFDIAAFRVSYPEFADETEYPDATLQAYWDAATCYISDDTYGCLGADCRELALNLMTAHLAKISTLANSGSAGGFVNSATIDKVSVSTTPPPAKDQYSWWLSTTPYGQQLQALLGANIAGGMYVCGRAEKRSFRKVGGYF